MGAGQKFVDRVHQIGEHRLRDELFGQVHRSGRRVVAHMGECILRVDMLLQSFGEGILRFCIRG